MRIDGLWQPLPLSKVIFYKPMYLRFFYMCTNAMNVYLRTVNNCVLSLFMNQVIVYALE